MATSYDQQKITILLDEAFTDEELLQLCYDEPKFEAVYGRLSKRNSKREIIAALIRFADRNSRFEAVLNLAKSHNLAVYEKHHPYETTSPPPETQPIDAKDDQKVEAPPALIMKGGGVKGLAYIGALRELENHYNFNWFVGTSAGAIAAVLLGAGYTLDELEHLLSEKDFRDFFDSRFYQLPGNLFFRGGLYPARTFTKWIDDLLARKLDWPVRVRLSDLPNRVTIYASRREKEAIIFDSSDPKTADTDAAYAVRCSMSIPLVFIPEREAGLRVFDGGMQNNYPVKTLLGDNPDADFIGLYLGPEHYEGWARESWFIYDLISIWTESSDVEALRQYRDQTVIIDPRPIKTLEFNLTGEEKRFLLKVGQVAARKFLKRRGLLTETEDIEAAQDELQKARERITHARKKRKRKRLAAAILITVIAFFGFMRISGGLGINGLPSTICLPSPDPVRVAVAELPSCSSNSQNELVTQWTIDNEAVATALNQPIRNSDDAHKQGNYDLVVWGSCASPTSNESTLHYELINHRNPVEIYEPGTVIVTDNLDRQIQAGRAFISYQQGNYPSANERFDQLPATTTVPEAALLQGNGLLFAGQYTPAIGVYQNITRGLKPNWAAVYINMGMARFNQDFLAPNSEGVPTSGRDFLEWAGQLAADQKDADLAVLAHSNSSLILLQDGSWEAAKGHCDEALAWNSRSSIPYLCYVAYDFHQGNRTNAALDQDNIRRNLDEAETYGDPPPKLYYFRALWYKEAGDDEKAAASFSAYFDEMRYRACLETDKQAIRNTIQNQR